MAHHNIQSNSSVSGMMIPTPGISHNLTGTMRMSSSMESNQGINPTSGSAGAMSNGYQLSHGNMSINQPGNTSMSGSIGVRRQVMPQMIPTPGFNSTSTAQTLVCFRFCSPRSNNNTTLSVDKWDLACSQFL
ncbi:histone acetyltransferase HAC1-like isoform X2 [Carex littledalei]|uniref:Histone acetyltransferase HAC1-like isoform X2 n=1 Tax=Carex littledalei TaxID=544730 RepID=A0A833S192_9POAL|nr:histone acetyltransferase HAC1-like isoform X2 [Carex littledalei]